MRTPPIPGPWHYETNARGNVVVYATRSGDDDKIIIGMSQFGSLEQREANARAICNACNELNEWPEANDWPTPAVAEHELYYLRSILTQLESVRQAQTDTSLGGEVLADNIDWLDCFIERNTRASQPAQSPSQAEKTA